MSDNKRFVVMTLGDARKLFPDAVSVYSEWCDEWGDVLIDTATGKVLATDFGELEDQFLCRDWSWVAPLLNALHEAAST